MLSNFVDGADIRMVQCGRGASLTPESFQCLSVFGKVFGKKFEGNETAKFRVLGLVHNTHPAATQLFDNAVVGACLADERVGLRHSGVILGCDQRQVNEETG